VSISVLLPPAPQLPREQIAADKVLCDYCTGKCCRYLAIPLDPPKKWSDYDDMRWYLAHENVSIFVEAGGWYVLIHNKCKHLEPDNRCGIYHDRMQVCRDHKISDCEYEDDFTYDMLFESDRQIWEYAEAVLPAGVAPKPSSF
jgi:uncharacterized protein